MLVAHSFAAMDGGHFPMLSGPGELADRLERYSRSAAE